MYTVANSIKLYPFDADITVVKKEFADQIQEWERLIRSGQGDRASREIAEVNTAKVSRHVVARFANVARRADQSGKAVRVLYPIVRGDQTNVADATPEEKLEYAASLLNLGSELEAGALAESVPAELHPYAYLVQAFACFRSWEYAAALPLLRRYIDVSEELYQSKIARVSLVAALMFTQQNEEARTEIKSLKEDLAKEQANLLLANVFEMEAQIELREQNFTRSRELLDESLALLSSSSSRSWIYSQKWKTVIDLKEAYSKSDLAIREAATNAMEQLREDAAKRSEWETLRECDFHLGIARKDPYLLNKAYYGTPHFQYRKMMEMEFPDSFEVQDYFCFGPLVENPRSHQLFHLERGECLNGDRPLKQGQVVHRLLKVLASDFYHPFALATLFSRMFPDDFFNPDSAPDRIYQAVKRFRQWCEEEKVPFLVDSECDHYQLGFSGDLVLIIPQTTLQRGQGLGFQDYRLESLFRQFHAKEFSAKDAANHLETSSRTINRLLKDAMGEGHVVSIGAGAQKRYKIVA